MHMYEGRPVINMVKKSPGQEKERFPYMDFVLFDFYSMCIHYIHYQEQIVHLKGLFYGRS